MLSHKKIGMRRNTLIFGVLSAMVAFRALGRAFGALSSIIFAKRINETLIGLFQSKLFTFPFSFHKLLVLTNLFRGQGNKSELLSLKLKHILVSVTIMNSTPIILSRSIKDNMGSLHRYHITQNSIMILTNFKINHNLFVNK